MTSGQVSALVVVVGSALASIGVTGIDPNLLTGSIQGLISIVTLLAAVWTWWKHRQLVKSTQ